MRFTSDKIRKLKQDKLKQFLSDPDVLGVIKDACEQMQSAVLSAHRLIELPELAHVDPQILVDIRAQGYALFQRSAAVHTLLFLVEQEQSNDYIDALIAELFLGLDKRDDGLRALVRTTLATYAPAVLEKINNA